jgi:UDP-N-acetylglucosamine--dolichyl-phosphate N-acetylglucosaminephosphotransferase
MCYTCLISSICAFPFYYDFEWIHKACFFCINIFCFHSINIYAGINSLEVGQLVMITMTVIAHNLIHIIDDMLLNVHMFSLCMMQPFLASSLGLLIFIFYPASTFVGHTHTLFADTILVMAGTDKHSTRTKFIFFMLQFVNFVCSLP